MRHCFRGSLAPQELAVGAVEALHLEAVEVRRRFGLHLESRIGFGNLIGLRLAVGLCRADDEDLFAPDDCAGGEERTAAFTMAPVCNSNDILVLRLGNILRSLVNAPSTLTKSSVGESGAALLLAAPAADDDAVGLAACLAWALSLPGPTATGSTWTIVISDQPIAMTMQPSQQAHTSSTAAAASSGSIGKGNGSTPISCKPTMSDKHVNGTFDRLMCAKPMHVSLAEYLTKLGHTRKEQSPKLLVVHSETTANNTHVAINQSINRSARIRDCTYFDGTDV